ncbi:WGR domain-containing protein [Microvirga guangxiensis]|uniref:WGR domain-containing protein n=1 Tax=Microvirga guangxiensis TaxID=549386 RepID=UPI000B8682F2|nr:WGR domain-containing protein [Microvirga guangxiensis]
MVQRSGQVQRDLFGTIRLVHNWGPVGSRGQDKVELFPDEVGAIKALETWAEIQRQKGFTDL